MLPILRGSMPLADLDLMDREFGRMMRRFWGDGSGGSGELAGTISYPVDMWEDDDNVHVRAELPGFTKEDVEITIEQGVLHISAERSTEQRNGSDLLNERRYTRYHRSFSLPTAVDDTKVDAKLNNGVLTLTLPKRAEVKPRRIKVG